MTLRTWLRKCAGVLCVGSALAGAGQAWGAISCSVSVTAMTVVYDPTIATENITTGSYTVSCTRASGDPNTLSYSLAANNGLQPTGTVNRVAFGTNFYRYELYRTTPYVNGNRWQTAGGNRFTGTISFGTSLTGSDSKPFDLRMAGSQPVGPAGTYIDTVTTTLRNTSTNTVIHTGAFGVSVITTNSCQITTPPASMNFTYASFQATPAVASSTFGARCTSGLPYSMALDVTSGALVGLNYSLALSTGSATGTGVVQSFAINGSIAAGQSGTCGTASCSGSQPHVLTITY